MEQSLDSKVTNRAYYYAVVKGKTSKCAIYSPKNRKDNLIIDTNFYFRPEDSVIFNSLKQAHKNRFISELQFMFMQIGVRRSIRYDAKGNLEIKVLKAIYFEAQTKHLLLTYVHDVFQASYMAMIKFGQFRDSMWPEGADRPPEDYGGYFSLGK